MKNSAASPAMGWIRRLALLLAVFSGSANAAVYTGVWDPTYGNPFTNLGWRGTAEYFVPDTCVPGGTIDISNSIDCSNAAIVTQAQVEFYDINASGQPTISTLVFNPASLIIGTLSYVAGELTQLTTTGSNYVSPVEDLSAFGVNSNTEFSLFFTLDGPRLAWQQCYDEYFTYAAYCECASGVNDATQFPATFTITRVPEPGTLALACLALLALSPRRVRAALLPRR